MEDEEALETSALIGQLPDAVEDQIDDLFADGVVATGVVVGGIFLSGDELLGVEELAVGASTNLICEPNDVMKNTISNKPTPVKLTDYGWLEIDEDCSWDVLASTSFTEKGVEGVISASNSLVTWHLTVRLDAMLQAVQFPAGITDLDTSLSDVDRDTFTLMIVG